jgi:hypothetical protein
MQTKLHTINKNVKLRLQCNVDNKRSPVKCEKTLTMKKNIHVFVWGFGWDSKNEPKI